MKSLLTLVILALSTLTLNAQLNRSAAPSAQPFGVVDRSDLEMNSCDFEKDANAEVLFDKGAISFTFDYQRVFERHIRIKIFNDNGKDEANIKLRYFTGRHPEYISDVKAETLNLNNGVIEVTKVDKQQIFTQRINKLITEIVFSFPAVKPGSIVEYKYTLTSPSLAIPNWYFQSIIPIRYSEISTDWPQILSYKSLVVINQPFAKNNGDVKALANVPSLKKEPFMGSLRDNVDRIVFQLTSINKGALSKSFADTWQKIAEDLIGYDDFGGQFKRKLTGEDEIINKANSLNFDTEKIAGIFNEVRNRMKWNGEHTWLTTAGTAEAWDKKKGNSAEINLILYHLLRKSGIKAFPMLVSTKSNGKVYPSYPNKSQFNKVVAYVPVDSSSYYILDATNKYNTYNIIPLTLLSGYGLCINPDADNNYELVFLEKKTPSLQSVYINAEIMPDGNINGTAEINSNSYHRISAMERYKSEGEKKYITYLRDKDNNLKITALKVENMDTDTLPLKQSITFTLAPAVPDENYIYFCPNLFTRLRNNPFLSEKRLTDIDFEYRNNYVINGIFKIPSGYKADVLPKNISMTLPDKSITFRRTSVEQDGSVAVKYVIDFKKSWYAKADYPAIYEFYKKMYEMLNEQVVLKRSRKA